MGSETGGQEVACVVCDTGPVLHLTEADCLELLANVGRARIPPSVDAELGYYIADWQSRRPEWLAVEMLTAPHDQAAVDWHQAGLFDLADAEAIALTRQLGADWILTDDAGARLFAGSLGIEAHGSLGVVLWAAANGHLGRDEAEAALSRLQASSLWITAKVMAEAGEALRSIFA